MTLAVYCLLFIIVGVGFIFVHLVLGKLIRPNRPGAEKKTIYECGEPTIGSAWIQFDLRFYVVALLFVIFDVEVAFFFPWAEVFGRANDVAALTPPKAPPTPPKAADTTNPTEDDHTAYHDYSQDVLAQGLARSAAPPLLAAYQRLAKDDRSHFKEDADLVDREGVGAGDAGKPTDADFAAYRDYCGKILALAPTRTSKPALLAAYQRLANGDMSQFGRDRLLVDKGGGMGSNTPSQAIPAASSLAWMAFFDILVFFGVLLVGFAYLWRRGDLAWVRSTAAERPAPAPPAEPSPAPTKPVLPALTASTDAHH